MSAAIPRQILPGSLRLGLIGTGNIGEAIVKSARLSGISNDAICVSARSKDRLAHLRKTYQVTATSDNVSVASNSTMVMLCVKPFQVRDICNEISSHLKPNQPIVSMAAGIRVSHLKQWLPPCQPIIRCMPNMPISIGKGMVALYKDGDVDDLYCDWVTQVFSDSSHIWLDHEDKIDLATAVSGCGPGFIAYVAEQFVASGVELGLSRREAEILVLNTFSGSGNLFETSAPLDIVREVASEGGATHVGVEILESWGCDHIFHEAIKKAHDRVEQISRGVDAEEHSKNVDHE